jgi:hypothetical protein
MANLFYSAKGEINLHPFPSAKNRRNSKFCYNIESQKVQFMLYYYKFV